MAIDRHLWFKGFTEDNIPSWRCPTCEKGTLKAAKDDRIKKTPVHVKNRHMTEDWAPYDDYDTFAICMICDNSSCGEPVMVSGTTEWVDDELDGRHVVSEIFRVRAVCPPLNMFQVPDEVPRPIKREIRRAFEVYWLDDYACAAALRAAVERLLDHLQVPKKYPNGDWMALAKRINVLAASNPKEKESLHALRNAGNLGAHGSELTAESVLDAMELLEDALIEILEIRKKRIDALRTKLKSL